MHMHMHTYIVICNNIISLCSKLKTEMLVNVWNDYKNRERRLCIYFLLHISNAVSSNKVPLGYYHFLNKFSISRECLSSCGHSPMFTKQGHFEYQWCLKQKEEEQHFLFSLSWLILHCDNRQWHYTREKLSQYHIPSSAKQNQAKKHVYCYFFLKH